MAQKRMFSMSICDSDAFLSMPLSTQCLYFHLNMRADDDGFVGNPRRIADLIKATDDDLKLLIAKNFVLTFDHGVIVIKHWRMHNCISRNRYHETVYVEEKEQLLIKDNNSYSLTSGVPIKEHDKNIKRIADSTGFLDDEAECENERRTSGAQVAHSVLGLGLDIDKEKDKNINANKKGKFIKPSVEDVKAYCEERHNKVDAECFVDFYESKGWLVGKAPMKDWKSAVRTWERNDRSVSRKGYDQLSFAPSRMASQKPTVATGSSDTDGLEDFLKKFE